MTTARRAEEGIGIGKDEMGMDGIGRRHGRFLHLRYHVWRSLIFLMRPASEGLLSRRGCR